MPSLTFDTIRAADIRTGDVVHLPNAAGQWTATTATVQAIVPTAAGAVEIHLRGGRKFRALRQNSVAVPRPGPGAPLPGRPDIRARAVAFAQGVVLRSTDWQQVQHALADHPDFGPWLDASGDPVSEATAIIRDAETALGGRLPVDYA